MFLFIVLDLCQEQFPGACDSWLANYSFLELQQGALPGMRLGDKRGVNSRLVMIQSNGLLTNK